MVSNKHIILILLLIVSVNLSHSQSKNDSLRLIWQNDKVLDSLRFKALEDYYDINNQAQPNAALASLDFHYKLAKDNNDLNQLFMASKRKGNIHRLKGNYNVAMSNYKEAEGLATQLNNPLLQASIMGNIGNVFIYRQDYRQATKYFSNALKIYQNIENIDRESHMLTNLGSVYLIIDNYDLALEYYQKALSLVNNKDFEDKRAAIIYINIGWTNFEKEQYKEAKRYYEKGLKIVTKQNKKFFIANCYSTLARIHLKLNQLDSAYIYARKNLAINKELDIKSGIIDAEIILAQLTFETNVKEATKKGESILARLPSTLNKDIKIELYDLLYKCYKSQNEPSKSLKMFENFTIYNDSIQLEKNNFAVAREAVKNDFDLKLRENKLQNEKHQAQLELKQLKRTFGIISASALLIGFIVFYFRRKIKKDNKKREGLLEELEQLKNKSGSNLVVDSKKFELKRDEIETSINRKLNETDWNVLNILLEEPEITNKQIAENAFMSVDGIGSSLRRMYEYFEIKDSKYKKIALLSDAIKRSNN